MIHIVEPIRGIELLWQLHQWMLTSQSWTSLVPKLADIFIFVYPVYFLFLYFWGKKSSILKDTSSFLKGGQIYYKMAALFVAASALFAVVFNLIIQIFVDKVRPHVVLGLADEKTETILHKFLPESSFPSDHAALSMAIAMGTLVWGLLHKDRRLVWLSIPFFVFSLVMSWARVTSGIHWPTDVIAGTLIGMFVPLLLSNKKIFSLFTKISTWIAKKI